MLDWRECLKRCWEVSFDFITTLANFSQETKGIYNFLLPYPTLSLSKFPGLESKPENADMVETDQGEVDWGLAEEKIIGERQ